MTRTTLPAAALLALLAAAVVGTAAERIPPPRPARPAIPAPHLAPPRPADGYEVVVYAPHRPIRVRVTLRYDGKPIAERWTAALRTAFDAFDRDHDGWLSETEVQHVFSDGGLAALFNTGSYNPATPDRPFLAALDTDGDGRVAFHEYAAYYQTAVTWVVRAYPVQPENAASTQATEALFKLFDANGDGKLTRAELAAAEALVATNDADEDECLSLAELVSTAPNGVRFAVPVPSTPRAMSPAGGAQAVEFHDTGRVPAAAVGRVLKDYDKDGDGELTPAECGFDADTFARLDADGDGRLTADELDAWRTGPADLAVTLSFASKAADCRAEVTTDAKTVAARGFTVRAGEAGRLVVRHGRQPIEFWASASTAGRVTQMRQFEAQFRQAAGSKGYVEDKDFTGQKAVQLQMLRVIVDPADADGDGKLTRAEFDRYFGLLQAFADLSAAVTPAVQTPTLFQLLDENRDGRLGVRELRTAWDRLRVLEPVGAAGAAEVVTRAAIQPTVTVRLGRPAERLAPGQVQFVYSAPAQVAVPRKGPVWFRKMDRNGDGDVSRAEFLGTRAEFDAIDADHDGLVSLEEAAARDKAMRGGDNVR